MVKEMSSTSKEQVKTKVMESGDLNRYLYTKFMVSLFPIANLKENVLTLRCFMSTVWQPQSKNLQQIHQRQRQRHQEIPPQKTTVAQSWRQSKCPWMGEWIKKIWSTHTTKQHSALKEKEILAYATTWMKLIDTVLNKIRQTQRILYAI